MQRGWSALGAVEPIFLPVISDREMFTHIARTKRKEVALQALWKGRTCETGSLSRQKDHPVVEAILAKYGAGLLARTVARLCELAMISGRLAGILDSFPSAEAIEEDGVGREGFGLAQVEAARGRLVHFVQVDQGVVKDYAILAPTEWNFHPEGVMARTLTRIGRGTDDDVQFRARMLVKAIDPCVGFEVRLR